MTMPAPITSEHAWAELVEALYQTRDDIAALRDGITGRDTHDMQEETPMTDYWADPDREALIEDEREKRADFESDGRLDGDYDPDDRAYADPTYDDPDLEG
jgi:hypothetical protein